MANTEAPQDTARAQEVAALERDYAKFDSAQDLHAHQRLVRDLRNLAIELHRQARKPFPFSEEASHVEDLAMCHWRGYNEGLGLATRALEHLLEEPSSRVP